MTTMRSVIAVLALSAVMLSAPAGAHKKHHHAVAAEQHKQPAQPATPAAQGSAAMRAEPTASHAEMGEMMEPEEDRSKMGFGARLLDWLGRLHPTIVHFPIAFFPAALVTALVGRRRPAFEVPVRFLVIAGGVVAPLAAILGWLDSIGAEPSALLDVHRWLGTGIGLTGAVLAIWAWRRPHQCRSAGMLVALAAITAAIIVQGWYGGAMVHGIEHLSW